MDEFRTSLHLAFPHVLDISHLMDEISPLKKLNSVSAATSYMKRRFFAPIDAEIPQKGKLFVAILFHTKTNSRVKLVLQ